MTSGTLSIQSRLALLNMDRSTRQTPPPAPGMLKTSPDPSGSQYALPARAPSEP